MILIISLSIPGQYTVSRACCLVWTNTWSELCKHARVYCCNALSMKPVEAIQDEATFIVRWFLADQHCLHSSGTWLWWSESHWWWCLKVFVMLTTLSTCLQGLWCGCFDGHCYHDHHFCYGCISIAIVAIFSQYIVLLWSCTRFHKRASGAWLLVPLSHSTNKLLAIILVLRRCNHGFSISLSWWLFAIGMSGWWCICQWSFGYCKHSTSVDSPDKVIFLYEEVVPLHQCCG